MALYIKSDLEFILDQIIIAERNAAGEYLLSLIPNPELPFRLRAVSGEFNNIVPGRRTFGQADEIFPRTLDPVLLAAEAGTSCLQTSGLAIDSQPRSVSNLLVDTTATNPAAWRPRPGPRARRS